MNNRRLHGSLELDWINKNMSLIFDYDEDGEPSKPTWVETSDIRVSEPRVLRLKEQVGEPDNENMLIQGDNLLALRTLVEIFKNREEKDKVKCVYIDPPFNTGSAFAHYDDNLEHSQWLTMMRDRLVQIKSIMRRDGAIFVHVDSNEAAHLKVLMDEVFGRGNFLNMIAVKTLDPSGFKSTGVKIFSTVNFILLYAINRSELALSQVFLETGYDRMYSRYITNISDSPDHWNIVGLNEHVAGQLGFANPRDAASRLGKEIFMGKVSDFALGNAQSVFRLTVITGGARQLRISMIEESEKSPNKVFVHHKEDYGNFYILNGQQISFYERKLKKVNGILKPGVVLTDFWTDISWNGIASEGRIEFKNAKKPEALLKRVLDIATSKGDLVLDSFAGSGTTAAVAHKMGRKWIVIELGKHAETFCLERLKGVVSLNNPDMTGISREIDWKGGGGFRFYSIGDSVVKSNDMNWDLTFAELAEAVFMNFNFTKLDKELKKGVFVGRATKKGRFALCSVTTDIEIVKLDELTSWLSELGRRHGLWNDVDIYTNKGIGVRADSLPDGVVLKKIPESILAKYNL